ncbi:AraC family transcriptional regulator [Pseudomonas lopnurensis]|uniref:AraC family transcriptional regulator n=1 Tax=Pseudomonas lopnurensis TaxID=1477517 RepID=UPI0028A5B3C4|nr:helix-turn-helix transcriptional regulator [Pseudomonas lopnurensis]
MNAIEYNEYESDQPGDFFTEASLVQRGFDVRIERAQWSASGIARIRANGCALLRLMLPSRAGERQLPRANLGSLSSQPGRRFLPLGPLLYITYGSEFHLYHGSGEQKALVCIFDPNALSPLVASGLDWSVEMDEHMLNLNSSYVRTSLQRLAEEVAAPGFASELHTECLISGIALDLRRRFVDPHAGEQSGRLSQRQLRLLRDLLENGGGEPPSLLKLADACDLPVRKLSSQFKNTTGQTLRGYAAQVKVKRAMALLEDHRLLVKQVAYQAGFHNAAAFSAAFRKTLGVTPEEFRRQRSG